MDPSIKLVLGKFIKALIVNNTATTRNARMINDSTRDLCEKNCVRIYETLRFILIPHKYFPTDRIRISRKILGMVFLSSLVIQFIFRRFDTSGVFHFIRNVIAFRACLSMKYNIFYIRNWNFHAYFSRKFECSELCNLTDKILQWK